MAQAGCQELKPGMITGGADLFLKKEKTRRIPSLFPRHRKDQEARKSPVFKFTEQNRRTGSKTKISPLRAGRDGAIQSCRQAEPGKEPRGQGMLGRKVAQTLKELRL